MAASLVPFATMMSSCTCFSRVVQSPADCRLSLSANPARLQQRPFLLRAGAVHVSVSRRQPVVVQAAAAAASPSASQQKIRIKLSAYEVPLLNESVEMIRDASQQTGARMSGPVPLPTRRRVYTVLRSPHVNKDAREQFERRTHYRLMDLRDLSSQTVDRLMQLDLPAGVDIDVKLL